MKKWFNILAWPVILAPLVYLWKIWPGLADQVPVHYNLKGEADRMGARSELLTVVLVLTGVNIAVLLFLPRIYKIDPRKTAADNKGRLTGISVATVILLSVVTFMIVDSAGKPKLDFKSEWIVAAIGLFWCVMGNYMYNIKPNYFAGIRLPWTLNNEDNWRLTHRLAGKLWFAGGVLMVILAFLLPSNLAPVALFAIAFVTVLIPAVYSYRMYARTKTSN